MIFHLKLLFLLVVTSFGYTSVAFAKADASLTSAGTTIAHISYLKEKNKQFNLKEVIAAHKNGEFTAADRPVLDFGIGSSPVWIRLEVHNAVNTSEIRRLIVENAWLDNIVVYFPQEGKDPVRYQAGDSYPFKQRPIQHRFFAFDHSFEPGSSDVYIRVQTPDPMLLPVYLMTPGEAQDRQTLQGYSYGFVYGFIIALAIYNAILFFSLRYVRYLYYALYLIFFIAMNIAYTGHGFQWLWSSSTTWQIWSNPVLMMLYGFAGFRFATKFLESRRNFPRFHKAIITGCIGFGGLLVFAVFTKSHELALNLSFTFILLFSTTMLALGFVAVYAGQKSAKYFLYASLSAMIGALLTALAVWGAIPYSAWTYRAVEIGMLIDSVLLAMALADQFRISQEEKIQAERLAKVDPLTGMNNRRGFYDTTRSIWLTAQRHNRDISVIVLDIDHFKFINDTYGHTQGDKVLVDIAKYLLSSAREGDILARWGGEEFIIFLPETDIVKASGIAERLRKKLAELRIEVAGKPVGITASFGVACRHVDSKTLDNVIAVADKLLYKAKETGRNRVYREE